MTLVIKLVHHAGLSLISCTSNAASILVNPAADEESTIRDIKRSSRTVVNQTWKLILDLHSDVTRAGRHRPARGGRGLGLSSVSPAPEQHEGEGSTEGHAHPQTQAEVGAQTVGSGLWPCWHHLTWQHSMNMGLHGRGLYQEKDCPSKPAVQMARLASQNFQGVQARHGWEWPV